jgi:hypothetical protein
MPIPIRPIGTPPGLTHPEKEGPSLDEVSGPAKEGYGDAPAKTWSLLAKHGARMDPAVREVPMAGEKRKGIALDFASGESYGAAHDELEEQLKRVKGLQYGLDLLFHTPAGIHHPHRPTGRTAPGEKVRAFLVAYTQKGVKFLEGVRAAAAAQRE